MRLKNSYKNEFGELEGTAFFPYFKKKITVICRGEVSPEYVEKCLGYLEEVDEALILRICKYAEFFLKDTLENTSIGEMMWGDAEAFPHDGLLELLQYFSFHTLYIDEPPESVADASEISVLNLSGACDWQEDEELQCLVKNGEVIYLGYFGAANIWYDYFSESYYGNYALYERRNELREKAAKKVTTEKAEERDWRTDRFVRWRDKGLSIAHRLEDFADHVLTSKENVNPREATEILEATYLYQLMNEYPQLLEESTDFWEECYCIEKEKDIGELVRHICENCQWDMF